MPVFVTEISMKCPREEVLRLLKYKEGVTEVDQGMMSLIDMLIAQGKEMAEPKALYKDFLIKEVSEKTVVLDGASFDLVGKSNTHRLWNSVKVTLFVATIGPILEKKMEEYTKQGAMTNASILDAVGSVLVESVVDYIDHLAQTRARKEGCRTTKRFSPGYGDWDIKAQKDLLKQIEASRIGVSLTDSYLMVPQKSVSGAIGWIKS